VGISVHDNQRAIKGLVVCYLSSVVIFKEHLKLSLEMVHGWQLLQRKRVLLE